MSNEALRGGLVGFGAGAILDAMMVGAGYLDGKLQYVLSGWPYLLAFLGTTTAGNAILEKALARAKE